MSQLQPKSLRDAVMLLKRLLRSDELAVIKNSKQSELARFHFNHGEYIRNLWVHRGGSPVTQSITAAGGSVGQGDEFSQLVIEALWHDLNNHPFDIRKSVHFNRIAHGSVDTLAAELWMP